MDRIVVVVDSDTFYLLVLLFLRSRWSILVGNIIFLHWKRTWQKRIIRNLLLMTVRLPSQWLRWHPRAPSLGSISSRLGYMSCKYFDNRWVWKKRVSQWKGTFLLAYLSVHRLGHTWEIWSAVSGCLSWQRNSVVSPYCGLSYRTLFSRVWIIHCICMIQSYM